LWSFAGWFVGWFAFNFCCPIDEAASAAKARDQAAQIVPES